MRSAQLALRGFLFHIASYVAVAGGVALAAAVVAGSIAAGDSVGATLRRSALARLGRIEHAVVGSPSMSGALSARVSERLRTNAGAQETARVLILDAAAENAESGATAPRVRLIGVDTGFDRLVPGGRRFGDDGRGVAVSRALASDLGLRPGDGLVVRAVLNPAASRGGLFGRRTVADAVRAFRVDVAAVLPNDGPAGFDLEAGSGARRTVLIDLARVQETLEIDHVTAVLTGGTRLEAPAISDMVRETCGPEDLGLLIRVDADQRGLTVRSRATTFRPDQVDALEAAAQRCGGKAVPSSIMLATSLGSKASGRTAHYAVVATRSEAPIADGEIVLTDWLAADLAGNGADLRLTWLAPEDDGSYAPESAVVRVAGVVPIARAAPYRQTVPEFPGITDASRIGDWDPPFPVDLGKVTPRDEKYWSHFGPTPKAFISDALMRRMWGADGDRRGWVTAVRVAAPGAQSIAKFAALFTHEATQDARAASGGPVVRELRREALLASAGSSDFRGLMLGMSSLIVLSALGLTGAMMRLAAERRASQIGLLLAVGFSEGLAARVVVIEGALACIAGALIGPLLGVPLSAALVGALNTGWQGAVARQPIVLHVAPVSLLIAGMTAGLLGLAVVLLTARRLVRVSPLLLLAGWRSLQLPRSAAKRRSGLLLVRALLPACLPALLAPALRTFGEAPAYFTGGAAILAACLGVLSFMLDRSTGRRSGIPSLGSIAFGSMALHRRQTVLLAGMVSTAAFILVTVAANVRSGAALDTRRRESGSGGFDLIARSAAPVAIAFDTPAGRAKLGFAPEEEQALRGVEVAPFMVGGGADASCLNLAKPIEPRVVGVPHSMIRRGGFRILTTRPVANPWTLLNATSAPEGVPAFADAETAQWILHTGLGKSIPRSTPAGTFHLRFEGLLSGSIFAGDLLVGEQAFGRMFPDVASPSLFLVRSPEGRTRAVAEALRGGLGSAGIEVRETREVLTEIMGVQNTYLAAFLVLGGLGMALGAAGLGSALLRSAAERRGEMALMSALGFTRSQLTGIMLREGTVVLATGLTAGGASAAVAALPRLVSGSADVNWPVLLAMLCAISTVGLASTAIAGTFALRGDLLRRLRNN